MFSPLTLNCRNFADSPMESTSNGHRLGKHLEASGLYAEESDHGFKHRQAQSMAAQGMTRARIGQAVQTKLSSIVELYADAYVTRHVPHLQRLSRRKHAMSCHWSLLVHQQWQHSCLEGLNARKWCKPCSLPGVGGWAGSILLLSYTNSVGRNL